ncbi:hypothetical protein ANMWB30_09380 [Arthrobacter sp. MWB30]|nr:hypothetical protein ANMWB30_09380 [Arthrobacter sp. MWB30]
MLLTFREEDFPALHTIGPDAMTAHHTHKRSIHIDNDLDEQPDTGWLTSAVPRPQKTAGPS